MFGIFVWSFFCMCMKNYWIISLCLKVKYVYKYELLFIKFTYICVQTHTLLFIKLCASFKIRKALSYVLNCFTCLILFFRNIKYSLLKNMICSHILSFYIYKFYLLSFFIHFQEVFTKSVTCLPISFFVISNIIFILL